MTMSQQDKERLLQTLHEDPVFLAEVRSLILSAELVQLPERFAEFAAHVTGFIERQEQFNAQQLETNAQQLETNATVASRLQSITDDLGDLKGHVAGRIAREMADDIAEQLGYVITEQLTGNDLRAMLRASTANDITPGTRRSFYVADLVARVHDQDRNELIIAVEASYTADERDTRRAIRNAELIHRFTGVDTVPVVASLENDHAVQELVDTGAIQWFQFQSRDLQPQ